MAEKDEKWELPERFRISKKDRTAEMDAMLQANDIEQIELREKIASPFQATTPRERERSNALILIGEYRSFKKLTDPQRDEYASALATNGFYELAARKASSRELKVEFKAIHKALHIPDEEWCGHGRAHAYAERHVFSLTLNADVALMRCGMCDYRNAKDTPDFVLKARSRRSQLRARYTGLKPLEAKAAMEADGILKR